MAGGGLPFHAAGQRRGIGRPKDKEDHAERARCVEPQRHGGDVGTACSPRQPEGHPGEDQVAHNHTHCRPRHEVGKGELGRIVEDGGQEGHCQHQVGEIVEREAKKGVDIAGGGPLVGLCWGG